MIIKVVGQDPSLRHWGLCVANYDTDTGIIQVEHVDVIEPILPTGKQTRVNSKDLETATQLHNGAMAACEDAVAVFVEVPVGSKSARAMASYGVCVGVLGAMRSAGVPLHEMSPTEVKVAATGKRTATKQDMIRWAMRAHPEARWPTYKKNGELLVSEARAEHMADALAAIYAGVHSVPFQQYLSFVIAKTQGKHYANSD